MVPGIDESLLTAYALGELSGADRAAVAACLASSVEARQFVADVRSTAHLLVDELARESFGGLSDLHHAAIEEKLDDALRIPVNRHRIRRHVRWQRTVFAMSLAASVAIVVGGMALMLPFIDHRIRMALEQRPAEQPTTTEQRPSPNPIIAGSAKAPRINIDPTMAGKNGEALARPDNVATADDSVLPEDWDVPQPDNHLTEAPADRVAVSTLLPPVKPRDVVPVKPRVQVTGPKENGNEPTVNPLTPKGNTLASPDPGSLGRPTLPADQVSHFEENKFVDSASEPTSGFSAGVDTASYSNIRRYLSHGILPPPDAVRIEEMLNYFPVRSAPPVPAKGEGPLVMQMEVGACPWAPTRRLARVCLQARELPQFTRPPVNLVFVVDVSDGMRAENSKLPLLKEALKNVVRSKLSARDRISLVTYLHDTVTVLPPTFCDDKNRQTLLTAIEHMEFLGRSNGGQGIEIAYELAKLGHFDNGVNRIILATDGNWNVGVTERAQLDSFVRDQTRNHVSITVLGVGMSNLKDADLQKLAAAGNGSYAYIDTLDEGRKVLADQVNGALVSVARDVKVQVTFNPATAKSYRLIGYERRILSKGEIHSESTRGGELGAGQSVTALYEVIPMPAAPKSPTSRPADLLTATVTYTIPTTLEHCTLKAGTEDHGTPVPLMSNEFRFAAAVADFGMLLRNSDYRGVKSSYSQVFVRAQESVGIDDTRYRHEFVKLIAKAKALAGSR